MKIDGGCHCGYITFEAEVDPGKVTICHCTDCQTLSGSAFRTVAPTAEGTFNLLTGELKIYVKTAESGAKRAQAFCPECGSPIYSSTLGEGPKVHNIRTGTIRPARRACPETANLGALRTALDRRLGRHRENRKSGGLAGC